MKLLTSTEVLFHIYDEEKGISRRKVINSIMRLRKLSKHIAIASINLAIKNGIIKEKEKILIPIYKSFL